MNDIICVCSEKTYFKDDIKGNCTICNRTIYYRPYNKNINPKMCTQCILRTLKCKNKKKPQNK